MWIQTSPEVYSVIYVRHKKELVVHSSFSDPTGNGHTFSTGKPEMVTEWGFKDADTPLIKAVSIKDNEQVKDYETNYFIYLHKNDEL